MSEENENIEISFGVVNGDVSVSAIEFADGHYEIPQFVIAELGGKSAIEQLAAGLKNILYAQFMEGFHKVRASRKVNEFQAQFVRNHFSGRKF